MVGSGGIGRPAKCRAHLNDLQAANQAPCGPLAWRLRREPSMLILLNGVSNPHCQEFCPDPSPSWLLFFEIVQLFIGELIYLYVFPFSIPLHSQVSAGHCQYSP